MTIDGLAVIRGGCWGRFHVCYCREVKARLVDRNLRNGCVVLQYPAYVVSFLLIATCKIKSWRSKRGLRMLHTHSDYLGKVEKGRSFVGSLALRESVKISI